MRFFAAITTSDTIGWWMCLFAAVFLISLAVFIGVTTEIMRHREWKEMTAKGYRWKFVISCSADPGSWQWVKD